MDGVSSAEKALTEILAVMGFDDKGHPVDGAAKRGLLARHVQRVARWSIDVRVYPEHREPYDSRLHVEPRGETPAAGQQTFVMVYEGHTPTVDFDRIHQANSEAASTIPEVAAALAAAGPDANRLVALLPGGPRVPVPNWTPLPTTAAGAVTATVAKCPNCGAPLELTPDHKCRYCEALVELEGA